MVLTPGYKWLDSAVIGENDLGQYDAFVIGRIRYIDRFNAARNSAFGSAAKKQFTWDLIRLRCFVTWDHFSQVNPTSRWYLGFPAKIAK